MSPLRRIFRGVRRNRGLALIIVLSMLALSTIVMLAFLTVAETEFKSTTSYSNTQSARRLADTALNLVIGQIRAGTDQDLAVPGTEFHATQPGAVRKYTKDGAFLAGYKLFSDESMIHRNPNTAGTAAIAAEYAFVSASEPESGWNTGNNTDRYVDLNEPVIKGVIAANGTTPVSTQVFFPVIDPRAAYDADASAGIIPVEGFQYASTTALRGNDLNASSVNGITPVQLPPNASIDALRLAMPVRWLYMLRDGTLGTLDTGRVFQGPAGVRASATNPIVARLAFWTDDECCKININTAGEPTFMGTPRYYHERDHRWADYPAARGEYQRFAGHPATVALSSVFYPNPFLTFDRDLETYPAGRVALTSGSAALTNAINVKERIYEIVPRLAAGGSNAGTTLFASDDFTGSGGLTTSVNMQTAVNERLYASMDELVFRGSGFQTANGRTRTNSTGLQLFNESTLERTAAFLTASSRGSEISMQGTPRICMWPISSDSSDRMRSAYDRLIQFCSTLTPGNSYIFQRSNDFLAQMKGTWVDATDIQRNEDLINMLINILRTATYPGGNTDTQGNTFASKLKGNAQQNHIQLAIEIFDYIRCTNLYDSFLAPDRNQWPLANVGDITALSISRDSIARQGLTTVTPGFVRNQSDSANPVSDRRLPGHGQMAPTIWSGGYRGFGRSITVSEFGLHFICTADGQPDKYSWRTLELQPNDQGGTDLKVPDLSGRHSDPSMLDPLAATGAISGGRTALKLINDTSQNQTLNYKLYSDDDFLARVLRPTGGTATQPKISNLVAVGWGNDTVRFKGRYYSNYPPNPSAGRYGTDPAAENSPEVADWPKDPNRHPGYMKENWNYSLDPDTPLAANQKRVQAMIHLEFFCPSVGYMQLHPEFTIVIQRQGINQITVSGRRPFSSSGDYILKSSDNIFDASDGTPQVGGFASFRRFALRRSLPGRGLVQNDPNYSPTYSGNPHSNLVSMDLVSDFFTVQSDTPMGINSSQSIRIDIYNTHDISGAQPSQSLFIELPATGRCPAPDLVVAPIGYSHWIDASTNAVRIHPTLQAPHWWSFHQRGVLNQDGFNNFFGGGGATGMPADAAGNPNYGWVAGRLYTAPVLGISGETSSIYDLYQFVPGAASLIFGYDRGNFRGTGLPPSGSPAAIRAARIQYAQSSLSAGSASVLVERPLYMGSDVVRSMQPGHGDPRIIYAKQNSTPRDWNPHRFWNSDTTFMAHNFSSYLAGNEPGFDNGVDAGSGAGSDFGVLPQSFNVNGTSWVPDAPFSGSSSNSLTATGSYSPAHLARRYYDFDESDPGGRIGPFINKPDEGNYSVGRVQATGWPTAVEWRSTYFRTSVVGGRFAPGNSSFFTPNRIVSSPVMLGSLPPYVHNNLVGSGTDPLSGGNGAWTNLLFRPHLPLSVGGVTAATHPGQASPPDHYLLDLFWMPVVEPYAISEPLSTAGKINMNYQMLPFTHIRRATALHAAMKGEMFNALPNLEYVRARGRRTDFGRNGSSAPTFRSEAVANGDPAARWHRSIALDRLASISGAPDNPWWQVAVGQRVLGTLRQFEERFNFGSGSTNFGPSGVGGSAVNAGINPSTFRTGLFRSASQICELHLVPNPISVSGNNSIANNPSSENVQESNLTTMSGRESTMANFWNNHASTGDNSREAIYSNLYAKLTTRSNTFRVHVRVQTLRKALRGSLPTGWVPGEDEITGEYRGSYLLERYIDRSDLARAGNTVDFTKITNFGADGRPMLDSYYRFRVLETKRFAP